MSAGGLTASSARPQAWPRPGEGGVRSRKTAGSSGAGALHRNWTGLNSLGRTIEAKVWSGQGGPTMLRLLVIALGLGAVVAVPAAAQYRYTNEKGLTRGAQYKLDVPDPYRDAAVWVGPTGVGKPGLSEEQRKIKERWDPIQKKADEARKADDARRAAEAERLRIAPTR